MSFWKRLAGLFRPDAPVVAAPKSPEPPRIASLEALRAALGQIGKPAAPLTPLEWNRPHKHAIPKPFPGVVPAGTASPATLAMDSWGNGVAQFGVQGSIEGIGWDGYSFMGYALLAELAQIPEFRRPSEIIADDMTREWVKLVSVSNLDKTEYLKDLNDEMDKFAVKEVFRAAFETDNFFGLGHIFVDLGDQVSSELQTPLVPSIKIKQGSLKALRLVEPMWTYPVDYNAINPLSADFYRPSKWYVMGTQVHASRLITIVSRPVPDMLKPAYQFGGLSLTQQLKPYVENWLRTRQSVSDITHNFSTPVLKVDMDQMTTKQGAEQLAMRAMIYNTMRDNQGLLVCSMTKEDFKIESAPLAGLAELQNQAAEQMAFPDGVPLVKLFGIAPSGLNASSEGEIRVYNDTIHGKQERHGTPHLQRVIEILQLNKFGSIDPDIGFIWQPLEVASEKEKAEIEKMNTEVDCALVDHDIISPLEVRTTIAAAEDSRYASIVVDKLPPVTDPALEGDPTKEPEAGVQPGGAEGSAADPARRDFGLRREASLGSALTQRRPQEQPRRQDGLRRGDLDNDARARGSRERVDA